MVYFHSPLLTVLWHSWLRPFKTLTDVTMTSSAYVIVTATLERYMSIVRLNRFLFTSRKHRIMGAIVAILLAVVFRGMVFFEITIFEWEYCDKVEGQYMVTYSKLAMNHGYRYIWMFWTRNILTVFFPFVFLIYMNFSIVRVLQRQSLDFRAAIASFGVAKQYTDDNKAQIQNATRMLVMIVSSYLLSNSVNVTLTIWEHIDRQSLLKPELEAFYTYSADIASILVIISCMSRLPIYCWCNGEIRHEISRLCSRKLTRESFSIQHNSILDDGTDQQLLQNGRASGSGTVVPLTGEDCELKMILYTV